MNKTKTKTKTNFANDVAVFFKTMKISVFIGLATACVLFFLLYEGHEYINPEVRVTKQGGGSMIMFGMNNYSIYMRAVEHAYGHRNIDVSLPAYVIENSVKRACEVYLRDKLFLSVFIGFLIFIGVPLLVVLYRMSSRTMKQSTDWIKENKSIE